MVARHHPFFDTVPAGHGAPGPTARGVSHRKIIAHCPVVLLRGAREARKCGCRVAAASGGSPWRSGHPTFTRLTSQWPPWIGWAMRSPSCRRTSTRRLRIFSTSSASLTRAAAGTPAFVLAQRGSPGESGSIWGPLASVSGWRARSAHSPGWRTPSPAGSCRTRRSALSLVWRLRRRRSGYSRSARPVPPSTSRDRKSTRLNSSHGYISYAVFCLKKKKNNESDIHFIEQQELFPDDLVSCGCIWSGESVADRSHAPLTYAAQLHMFANQPSRFHSH